MDIDDTMSTTSQRQGPRSLLKKKHWLATTFYKSNISSMHILSWLRQNLLLNYHPCSRKLLAVSSATLSIPIKRNSLPSSPRSLLVRLLSNSRGAWLVLLVPSPPFGSLGREDEIGERESASTSEIHQIYTTLESSAKRQGLLKSCQEKRPVSDTHQFLSRRRISRRKRTRDQ